MISPNTTLLFCKASPQGSNPVIIRLSISHWDIPQSSILSEKASDDYIWMQNLSTARVGRATEEMCRRTLHIYSSVNQYTSGYVISAHCPVSCSDHHGAQLSHVFIRDNRNPDSEAYTRIFMTLHKN